MTSSLSDTARALVDRINRLLPGFIERDPEAAQRLAQRLEQEEKERACQELGHLEGKPYRKEIVDGILRGVGHQCLRCGWYENMIFVGRNEDGDETYRGCGFWTPSFDKHMGIDF